MEKEKSGGLLEDWLPERVWGLSRFSFCTGIACLLFYIIGYVCPLNVVFKDVPPLLLLPIGTAYHYAVCAALFSSGAACILDRMIYVSKTCQPHWVITICEHLNMCSTFISVCCFSLLIFGFGWIRKVPPVGMVSSL